MPGIDARIAALVDVIQRRQREQATPIDGLSASLFALQSEFSELDDAGRAALLEAMNHPDDGETDSLNLSMENLDKFIESIVKG